jgi:hypothetical protein
MRRGLLRLWVIFAIIFIFAAITLNFDNLKYSKSQFDPTTATLALPVDCTLARGELGKNYTSDSEKYCWYTVSEFRKLFPEYKDLPDEKLSEKLYQSMKSKPDNHLFWDAIHNILIYGFGIPFLLLALSLCFQWIVAGFKNS